MNTTKLTITNHGNEQIYLQCHGFKVQNKVVRGRRIRKKLWGATVPFVSKALGRFPSGILPMVTKFLLDNSIKYASR